MPLKTGPWLMILMLVEPFMRTLNTSSGKSSSSSFLRLKCSSM
eukprot:08785.XXX_382913_383041_1 [CDS] Oithona nana genome sequencing.